MDLIKNSPKFVKNALNGCYSSIYTFFNPKNGTQSFFATRHWVYLVIVPWAIYTFSFIIYNFCKYLQYRKRRHSSMEVMERPADTNNGNIPMNIRHAVIAYALMAIRRIMRVPPMIE